MRRFIAFVLGVVVAVGVAAPVAAVAPSVSKVYRTYGSFVYTVTISEPALSVSASPRDGNPTTTGGCVNQFRRKSNGQYLFVGTACPSPGTVRFVSPSFPVCETPFAVVVDGVTVFTDVLNAPCPPPAPPAVQVVVTDAAVTFTNPATVAQSKSQTITVPECGHLSSADPFTVECRLNYAGIGLNRYTYWSETIGVTLAAGQTVTVLR